MSKKLKKDKSLYSIKKFHSKAENGNIYENDYTTIIRYDGIFDEVPLYTNSNFKYLISSSVGGKKRHVKLDWLLTDNNESAWTKSSVSGIVEDNNVILLKPNYSSLKDFAYYGSAVELIKATINDIILRFPGGLCYYDNDVPEVDVDGKTYYLISNECQIDCWSKNVTAIEKGENPLRYLSYSYNEYVDSNGNPIKEPEIDITGNCFNSIIGKIKINEENIFPIYKDGNGQNHLITLNKKTGVIIRPRDEHFSKFWSTIDDFERVLLNRESYPIYTAVFETPYKNEDGFYYLNKRYIWPLVCSESTTPDLTTSNFVTYLNSLLSLAEFHDEYDSNNLWRMMTHEAIKNLDWTYVNSNTDLADIDNSRLKAMLQIQGRQFDILKQQIDGIKNINILSYDGKNNSPDYFLTDIVGNDGWEITNVAPSLTSAHTYTKEEKDKINNEFLKRLGLSSNYIQSMKGTKKGIETILGLFGLDIDSDNPDVEIIEYYAKVKSGLSYSDAVCLRTEFAYVNGEENTNFMLGYPVTLVEETGDNDEIEIRLYPWYDKNEKYIGNFYYQCKGGWGKTNSLEINRKDITEISAITGNFIYKETEPYMLYVEDLKELTSLTNNKLRLNMICYVADITGIENLYKDKDEESIKDFSHYFTLDNIMLSTELGYVNVERFDCYGWRNIRLHEFNGVDGSSGTSEGHKVLYLETIKPIHKGNNPHNGKSLYDFGLDYLMKYKQLFREAIENGSCDGVESTKYNDIENFGFTFEDVCSAMSKYHICLSKNENETIYKESEEEEIESLKIINLKNITIRFSTKNFDKKYILDSIIPYIEMMIPSTMIVEYLFDDEKSYIETFNAELKKENNVTYSVESGDVINETSNIWIEDDTWNN